MEFGTIHRDGAPSRVLLYGQRASGSTNALNVLRRAAQASGKFASYVLVDPCPDCVAVTGKDGWTKVFTTEAEALTALTPFAGGRAAVDDVDDWSMVEEIPGPIFVGIDNGEWKLHRQEAVPPLADLWPRADLAIVTTSRDFLNALVAMLKPQVTCATATWCSWTPKRTKHYQGWCAGPLPTSDALQAHSPFARFVFARPDGAVSEGWKAATATTWLPELRLPGEVPLYWTSWWTTREAYRELAEDLPFPVWLSGQSGCHCATSHAAEEAADEAWQCPKDRFSLVAEVRAESEEAVWAQVKSHSHVEQVRFCTLTGPD